VSDTIAGLRRKIGSAGDLRSVVRTMKAVAAASIAQYERSVSALAEYSRTVEPGLSASFREVAAMSAPDASPAAPLAGGTGAVVFGSDQGLVGQFNDAIAEHAVHALAGLAGPVQVWAVGERARARLADAGLTVLGQFDVPSSVGAITPLVGRIQIESDAHRAIDDYAGLYVFHNRPTGGDLYEPASQRLLPLDAEWQQSLMKTPWPTNTWPEVIGSSGILAALVREYLFISLFRACAESLASENASRLSAMERADKNIEDLLGELRTTYHRVRQSGIDEELFDVVSGFEALGGTR